MYFFVSQKIGMKSQMLFSWKNKLKQTIFNAIFVFADFLQIVLKVKQPRPRLNCVGDIRMVQAFVACNQPIYKQQVKVTARQLFSISSIFYLKSLLLSILIRIASMHEVVLIST